MTAPEPPEDTQPMHLSQDRARAFLREHASSVRLLAIGLAAIGYLVCGLALLHHGLMLAGGEGGGDVFAYWTAGSNILAGRPVYELGVGGYAAFLYPPPLAQLFAPLSLLPFPVVAWLWRAVELVCLRVAVGSWTAAGIAMLVWVPVISELDAGNVHLLIAAAVAMAIRGRPVAVFPAALTKFASLVTVPLALVTRPSALGLGLAIAAGIACLSFALAPGLWFDYARFASHITTFDSGWYNLARDVPLLPRLIAAGVVAIAAIRLPRLAAVAATLALPVLWFHGLSVLVAGVARPSPANPIATLQARRSARTPVKA